MYDSHLIRERLYLQGIPTYEADIPYIQLLLHTVTQAQLALNQFPNLNQETPITIFDKGLIR